MLEENMLVIMKEDDVNNLKQQPARKLILAPPEVLSSER
jgi:hypothetical protein